MEGTYFLIFFLHFSVFSVFVFSEFGTKKFLKRVPIEEATNFCNHQKQKKSLPIENERKNK